MNTVIAEAIEEKRLMAAVVAQAIKDACIAPMTKTVKNKKVLRIRWDAATAMYFLFSTEESGVDAYALWLDFDVKMFREKLLKKCSSYSHDPYLNDDQKRNFMRNYRLFQGLSANWRYQDDEDDI